MDCALFHIDNMLLFMRQDELNFLELGCQVYLGARLSAYTSELSKPSYAMYPMFVEGQVISIASVSAAESGKRSFQVGSDFAQPLNEFVAGNPNIAFVVDEGSTQVVNDKGEAKTLFAFYNAAIPAVLLLSSIQFKQAVPATVIQEVELPQTEIDKENADLTDAQRLLRDVIGFIGFLTFFRSLYCSRSKKPLGFPDTGITGNNLIRFT